MKKTDGIPQKTNLYTGLLILILLVVSGAGIPDQTYAAFVFPEPDTVTIGSFRLDFEHGAITSLKRTDDRYDTDYILEGKRFGDLIIRYRRNVGEAWSTLSTGEIKGRKGLEASWNPEKRQYIVTAEQDGLLLTMTFSLGEEELGWDIELRNRGGDALEIGDVALPLPMNHDWSWNREVTYNRRVIRHSMIAGHNSYFFWMRCNAEGPFLLMTPTGDTGLEYYDHSTENDDGRSIYTAYIHSRAQKKVIEKHNGSWRLPHTGTVLLPEGEGGDRWKAGFKLQWAADYDEVRASLYQNGLFNIEVAPGMTVPEDLNVKIALKNRLPIHSIQPEHPGGTTVTPLGSNSGGYRIYRIVFRKLGENMLTVNYGDNRQLYLEFFVTEPIETLIRKRSRFLVERQQIRDTTKWYDGLLSDWTMNDELLLSPDNIHDIPKGRRYMIASDDPALSRPSFLAKKNVVYPEQEEVAAMDYYIDRFVWGGLQMTDEEAYPYAIYGIHDWKSLRESSDQGQYGKMHIWRIYDYPHIIQMYLSMYRIARYHPHIKTSHPPEVYLQRTFGTAAAFFSYPEEVIGWSPYETGNYNELSIVDLIGELEAAGWTVKAQRIRQQWEKKVAYFLEGKANLFGSEYPYDTTGFESTHAFARYAMAVAGRPSKKYDGLPLDVTREQIRTFMEQQVKVNVGSRGWLEKAYYLYGSDYRGSGNARYTLSYMAQMGGWSLLDYALHFSGDPARYLKLGYGSVLSSWALMNTGTVESDYGYWFPGKINDGGAGGGFEPLAYGRTWLQQPHGRGSWYYGCEIDLGFTGYLRAAATVFADDPVFGKIALGGTLHQGNEEWAIIPRDGVRRRFHVVGDNRRLHLSLDYSRFAADEAIVFDEHNDRIEFVLENIGEGSRQTIVRLSGWETGRYAVTMDGRKVTELEITGTDRVKECELSLRSERHEIRIERVAP